VTFGAGCRGVDQQRLGLVGVQEHLAVQCQETDLGMEQPLFVGVVEADFVVCPQGGELGTLRQKELRDGRSA
jgi:hypothetical protein